MPGKKPDPRFPVDAEDVSLLINKTGTRGVVVSRVEPLSPGFDAGIERGHVIIEVNRHPVRSIEDYRALTATARTGDVFAFYLFKPESGRALHTVRVE